MSHKRIVVIRHLMSHLRIPIVNTVLPISTSGGLRLTFAFVNRKMARSAWEYSGRSPGVVDWSDVLHNEEDVVVKMTDGSCLESVADGSLIDRHPLTNLFVSAKFASKGPLFICIQGVSSNIVAEGAGILHQGRSGHPR